MKKYIIAIIYIMMVTIVCVACEDEKKLTMAEISDKSLTFTVMRIDPMGNDKQYCHYTVIGVGVSLAVIDIIGKYNVNDKLMLVKKTANNIKGE